MRDPYIDPVSGVLRNRAGINDQEVLATAEAAASAVALYALATEHLAGGV